MAETPEPAHCDFIFVPPPGVRKCWVIVARGTKTTGNHVVVEYPVDGLNPGKYIGMNSGKATVTIRGSISFFGLLKELGPM
jgi:hypothetical protein